MEVQYIPASNQTLAAPGNGNAKVTLANGVTSQNQITFEEFPVWLYGIHMSLNTQFTNPQVRKGIVWSPLRNLSGFEFSIMWATQTNNTSLDVSTDLKDRSFNFNGFKKMNRFHEALRFHQRLATTTGGTPPPMKVVYYNNTSGKGLEVNPIVNHNLKMSPPDNNLFLEPIVRYGFIKQINKEYDRFKAVYYNSYVMEVLVPQTQASASISYTSNNPYVLPTSEEALEQGPSWVRKNISINVGINVDGIPS